MKIKNLINKIKFVSPEEAHNLIFSLDVKNYVIFIGLHGIAEYLSNKNYRISVDNAKYIFCDSIFVQFLSFIFNGKIPKKSPGPDVVNIFIDKIIKNNLEICFFGGKKEIISNKLISKSFKNFEIIEPGILKENDSINCSESKKILKLNKKYIFIAISCPKQEIVAYNFYNLLPNSVIIPVGAAINFYFDLERRAPLIFRKLGIEFIWRFLFSPIKIGTRIMFSFYKIFISVVFKK